jgi:pimeloyl-ACP methyl ester carboxylesterase
MKLEVVSRQPSLQTHATPLLFVHGLFLGMWCWEEHFLDYFAQHGYAAYALSLRGHGASEGRERLRWTRLAEYVDDVAQVAQQLSAPPVVIGHSNGGALVQKYLEAHDAPAGVLLASAPPAGFMRTTVRTAVKHPLLFAKVNLTLSLYPTVSTPALAREFFFSASMPEDKVRAYQAKLSDESYLAFLDMLVFNLPHPERVKAPMLVIGAANDTSFHAEQVHATARAYHTEAFIFPNMTHALMLEEGWQTVADHILVWLGERGL